MKWILPISVALASLAGCGAEPYVPVDLGSAAPSFKLDSVTDSGAIASDSLQGDIVVLNFWSTSCLNCIREIDVLKKIHESGKATVVGIALDEDRSRVQNLVDKKGITYQVLIGDQATFERFDGLSIPYTLVLDRSRTVRKKFHGPMSEAQFEDVLSSQQGRQETRHVAMRE